MLKLSNIKNTLSLLHLLPLHLINDAMFKIKQAYRYLRYLCTAKTRHDIHSPFIYTLADTVFKLKHHPDTMRIEFLRSVLRKDHSILKVIDHGAGSKYKQAAIKVSDVVKYSAVSPRFGRLYYQLVKHFKPTTILELGTSLGFGTLFLSSARPEAKVITIESCPQTAAKAQINFHALGLSAIELINDTFEQALPVVLERLTSIDFVLIDGNHQKEPTLSYFNQIKPFLSREAVVIFDDINWSEGMREAWVEIQKDPDVTVSIDLFFVGMVFLSPDLSKQDVEIRF